MTLSCMRCLAGPVEQLQPRAPDVPRGQADRARPPQNPAQQHALRTTTLNRLDR